MCDNLTYRSAGAETLVRMNTIDILLRWSKEGLLSYVGTAFVQSNSPDEPISYIRTHAKNRIMDWLSLSGISPDFIPALSIISAGWTHSPRFRG